MKIMKKTFSETGELSKIKKKNEGGGTKYEEILLPKEEDDLDMNEDEQRKTFTQAIFDFQKSHSQFENKEITNVKTNENSINTMSNNINNINNKINSDTNTSFHNEENTEYEKDKTENPPVEIGEYVEDKNSQITDFNVVIDTKGNTKHFFPLNKSKTYCFQCLHMILQDHCIKKYNKPFCSLHCLDAYENKSVITCGYCMKKFEEYQSVFSIVKEKVYYCSNSCKEKAEPNENAKLNTSQIMEQNMISPNSSEGSENVIYILDL